MKILLLVETGKSVRAGQLKTRQGLFTRSTLCCC